MNHAKRMLQSFMLFWSGLFEPPQPVRVGMLDTGELALVSDCGQAQVLDLRTTKLIAATLDLVQAATTARDNLAQTQTSGTHPARTVDELHALLHKATAEGGTQ